MLKLGLNFRCRWFYWWKIGGKFKFLWEYSTSCTCYRFCSSNCRRHLLTVLRRDFRFWYIYSYFFLLTVDSPTFFFNSFLNFIQHVNRKFVSANGTIVNNAGFLITPMDYRTSHSINSILNNHEFNQVSSVCDNNINCGLPTMYPYLISYVYAILFLSLTSWILWPHSNLWFCWCTEIPVSGNILRHL